MMQSALLSAERAEELGLGRDKIILLDQGVGRAEPHRGLSASWPRAATMRCIWASPRRAWDRRASSPRRRRCGILLQQGIGDTIRVSLTPEPGGDRTQEVRVAQELLQTISLRQFPPVVAACPGCGRTTSTDFPGAGQGDPGPSEHLDAGVERALSRC